MNKALQSTNQYFESSAWHTPKYLAWHRLFKKEFSKFLTMIGAEEIKIDKPNHFDMSGFVKMKSGQIWYFRIEDVRWSKNEMLLRTAKGFDDFTGEYNQHVPLTQGAGRFESEFGAIVMRQEYSFHD